MLEVLRAAGWTIRVWDRDDRDLYVDGTDNYGDRFRGRISRDTGCLEAEPVHGEG